MKKQLTAKQKKFYLDNGGNLCPYCKSDNIEAFHFDSDGTQAWRDVTCLDCNKTWTDIYGLTDVEAAR